MHHADLGRCVLIEHEKSRVGGEACGRHWHLIAPEWDPVRRRVLDASWMRPRQEKLSRLAEIRLGHSPVAGRWNAAVERRLREEGRGHDADRVAPLADVPRPQSAYTAVRHQAAACGGLSLPQAREAVATAWKSGDTGAARLSAIRDLGLVVRPGEKQGVWVVETAGAAPVLVGALHRLVREQQAAVSAALEKGNRDGCEEEAELHHRGRAAGPGRGLATPEVLRELDQRGLSLPGYARSCRRP